MPTTYAIHPAIGIARVGDSPDDFYLAPEATGALPIACDAQGNALLNADGTEQPITRFRDAAGRVARQAARFGVYVYDEHNPQGRPLQIGDAIQAPEGSGKLVDIQWHAYLANKKPSWFEFKELEGEHGYAPDHPLRNASVSGDARVALMIDPGPQSVDTTANRRASFARDANPDYAQTFPPPLSPGTIDTLGDLLLDDRGRLVLLGGHGASGSYLSGLGEPKITQFANNDGWFDDIADGPVTAILVYFDEADQKNRLVQVDASAWVLVGNPGYAPEIVNIITLDDVLYDVSVREFAYEPYLYGTRFDERPQVDGAAALAAWRAADKRFNPEYRPYFYRDIWPILLRPYNAQWTTNLLAISHDAHEIGPAGDFEESKLAMVPAPSGDDHRDMRMFVYNALRQHGNENAFANTTAGWEDRIHGKPLMPMLCGDNPISNTLTAKFLTLTRTQVFLLGQWAQGKFINERSEGIDTAALGARGPGAALDRGVLGNVLGGSFCPGGEIGWIARNPAIYAAPYRLNWNNAFLPDPSSGRPGPSTGAFFPAPLSFPSGPGDAGEDLATGLEPGDLTKRNALPWQADYNECATQAIDVTYEAWAKPYDGGPHKQNITLWWPTHRPMQVYRADPPGSTNFVQGDWARGIPETYAGDLKMVTSWKDLGFLAANPGGGSPAFYEVEARPPGAFATPSTSAPAAPSAPDDAPPL